MVRRVGFGGDEQPNERDKELRRRYHRTDGNHSDRAHKVAKAETVKPVAEAKPTAPTEVARKPGKQNLIIFGMLAFLLIPIFLSVFSSIFSGVFGGSSGGGFSMFGLLVTIFVFTRIYKFIKKALSQAQQ